MAAGPLRVCAVESAGSEQLRSKIEERHEMRRGHKRGGVVQSFFFRLDLETAAAKIIDNGCREESGFSGSFEAVKTAAQSRGSRNRLADGNERMY